MGILEVFDKYRKVGQLHEFKCLCFRLQLKLAAQRKLERVFLNVDFDILEAVEAQPLPAGSEIILEISETEALRDIERCLGVSAKWREKGYKFAIDDFGAGFISLPFIAQLVPDFIKMDRSTIVHATTNRQFKDLLGDMLNGLKRYASDGIIAEGVETETELQTVKELNTHIVQGFLLGHPYPIEE